MTKQELINTRNILFDENFRIKTDNAADIVDFCKELTAITGIQCCNDLGQINELLVKSYNSVLQVL